MDEMIKAWLDAMYAENIKEAKGIIENEKLWAMGSSSKEEEQRHLDNISVFQEYISVLEELRENVEAM